MIQGQITVFDMLNSTEIKSKNTVVKKQQAKPSETTELRKIIETYIDAESTSRIVKNISGSIQVEIKNKLDYKTLYFNRNGSLEFQYDKKATVLPWDKVVLYRNKNIELNDIQQQRLKEIKQKYESDLKEIIHRHGDENVLIETNNKVLSIISNGWVLEFNNINHVECDEDEILEEFKEVQKDINKSLKVGDYVQATWNNKIIEGEITREYGLGNAILNISFLNNGVKSATAIGRYAILKILNAA